MSKNEHLLTIRHGRNESTVKFPYSPVMAAMVAKIPGASFDGARDAWMVPVSAQSQLSALEPELRKIVRQEAVAAEQIFSLASSEAAARMKERGAKDGATPQVSSFHEVGHSYRGEILNANGVFAAQLTGFGREDGAAFVTVHRLDALDQQLFKGQSISVKYSKPGRARVELAPSSFEQTLGQLVSGVQVDRKGEKYLISFDYNPALSDRLNRVAGVEFKSESKMYEVPIDKHPFVARAVEDMRRMFIREQAFAREMTDAATSFIDGAKVVQPLRRSGPGYSGQVMGENEVFLLQHTGREYFTLHRKGDLDRVPNMRDQVRIQYDNGRGKVMDPSRGRPHGQSR